MIMRQIWVIATKRRTRADESHTQPPRPRLRHQDTLQWPRGRHGPSNQNGAKRGHHSSFVTKSLRFTFYLRSPLTNVAVVEQLREAIPLYQPGKLPDRTYNATNTTL